MFYPCHRRFLSSLAALPLLMVAAAGGQAERGAGTGIRPRADTVCSLRDPRLPSLWSLAIREGRPALYRLTRRNGADGTVAPWELTRMQPAQDGTTRRWTVSALGVLRPRSALYAEQPRRRSRAPLPGHFAVLDENAAGCRLAYSRTGGHAGFAVTLGYPYVECGRVDRAGRPRTPPRLSLSPRPDVRHMQSLGPMSVAWARRLDAATWLVLATSGHVLTVPAGPWKAAHPTVTPLGGIPGIANLKRLPVLGPDADAAALIRYARCAGAGELRGSSFTALCFRLSHVTGPPAEWLIFRVTVKDRASVVVEPGPSRKTSGQWGRPLVLPVVAPEDMELRWCCASRTGRPRKLLFARYLPRTGIVVSHLPFGLSGDIVAGYVDRGGRLHLLLVRPTNAGTADLVHVVWQAHTPEEKGPPVPRGAVRAVGRPTLSASLDLLRRTHPTPVRSPATRFPGPLLYPGYADLNGVLHLSGPEPFVQQLHADLRAAGADASAIGKRLLMRVRRLSSERKMVPVEGADKGLLLETAEGGVPGKALDIRFHIPVQLGEVWREGHYYVQFGVLYTDGKAKKTAGTPLLNFEVKKLVKGSPDEINLLTNAWLNSPDGLATLLLRRKDYTPPQLIRRVLEIDPNDAWAKHQLGRFGLQIVAEPETAVAAYTAILNDIRKSQAHRLAGLLPVYHTVRPIHIPQTPKQWEALVQAKLRIAQTMVERSRQAEAKVRETAKRAGPAGLIALIRTPDGRTLWSLGDVWPAIWAIRLLAGQRATKAHAPLVAELRKLPLVLGLFQHEIVNALADIHGNKRRIDRDTALPEENMAAIKWGP